MSVTVVMRCFRLFCGVRVFSCLMIVVVAGRIMDASSGLLTNDESEEIDESSLVLFLDAAAVVVVASAPSA